MFEALGRLSEVGFGVIINDCKIVESLVSLRVQFDSFLEELPCLSESI